MANMVDQANKQDHIDIVLRNLQPRFTRHLMGIPFQDFRSLVQANINVEKGIDGGLWTDPTPSLKNKRRKPIRSPNRFGEVSTINYQH